MKGDNQARGYEEKRKSRKASDRWSTLELTTERLELVLTCLVGRKCPTMRTLLGKGLQYSKYFVNVFRIWKPRTGAHRFITHQPVWAASSVYAIEPDPFASVIFGVLWPSHGWL